MLHRLLAIETAWSQYGGDIDLKPRQLFITRSQRLADKVKESFARLHKVYVSGSWQSTTERSQDENTYTGITKSYWTASRPLPQRFADATPLDFPMFLSLDTVSVWCKSLYAVLMIL